MRLSNLPCLVCDEPSPQCQLTSDQIYRLLDAGAEMPTFPVEGAGTVWLCLTCRTVWVYLATEVELPAGALDSVIPPRKEQR
jgi:hypothetical protein